MTEYGRIHTDGSRSGGQPLIKTQHCPNCEAQAAEIERLRRDHAAAVKEANIAKARLKGVTKQWHADRAALQEQSKW
jgi:hypothetical protein